MANICPSDLKSGLVSSSKLHNIIKSNQIKTLSYFTINIEYVENERTNEKN